MKVCIALDHRKRNISTTGKGYFAQRLIEAMKAKGIEFVSPEQKADIDLGIGRWQYTPNAEKKILRLGAAHIDINSNYKRYNRRKYQSLKIADGVIYQSWFSRRVCNNFIGAINKPYEIIYNGAKINNSEIIVSLAAINFLASTRDWIPQKNLKDIVKAFIEANNTNARLWITGITHGEEKKYKHPKIIYTGLVNQEEMNRLYGICDVMVNIVYADACPNNVVEALCSGCWILCGNSGGTPELIKDGKNGNILPLYKPYDYELVDLSKRIKIDKQPLIDAFKKLYSRHNVNDYLDIYNIADKYIEFFKKVLND